MNRPPPIASSMGMGGLSNAAKSHGAATLTKQAVEASNNTSDDDHESHQRAADAHRQASFAHQDAGNGTQADAHRKLAAVHQEKANAGYRAKDFAAQETRAAQDLTHKAESAQFGQDPDEARTPEQLHQDAAQAHFRASQAHALAGDPVKAQYHAAKAGEHQALGQPKRTGR